MAMRVPRAKAECVEVMAVYPGTKLMPYAHPAWHYTVEQVERFTWFDSFSAAYYGCLRNRRCSSRRHRSMTTSHFSLLLWL